MKKLVTAIILSLVLAAGGMADTCTLNFVKTSLGITMTPTYIKGGNDVFKMTGMAVLTQDYGTHRTVPYAATAEGLITGSTSNGGGGGGGGKLELPIIEQFNLFGLPGQMITWSDGTRQITGGETPLCLQFTNNLTGGVTSYTVNIPFVAGYVSFVGNASTGYVVGGWSVYISPQVNAGSSLGAPPQTIFKSQIP